MLDQPTANTPTQEDAEFSERHAKDTTNPSARHTQVVPFDAARDILTELLRFPRNQDVQIVVWYDNEPPHSIWLDRANAKKLLCPNAL